MTAPSARIVHKIPGRCRLRTHGMKRNGAYFAELGSGLSQIDGVLSVQTSPLTESVLIVHEGSIDPVLREAELRGYLHVDDGPQEPYLAGLDRALSRSDAKLRQATAGRMDFETLTFLGFLAGGIYQISQGRALPAGVTLLRYAVELVGAAGLTSLENQAKDLQK